MFFALAAALVVQTAVQSTTTVNVRTGPGTSYGVVGTVPTGHRYAAQSKTGSWWRIWYDGALRYTHANYYTLPSGVTGVRVTASALNVRNGPAWGATILGQVYLDHVHVRLALTGGWAQITWKGTTGYIWAGYTTAVALNGNRDDIVGIDINAPVNGAGALQPNTDPDRIAATGARWARVNYIGDFPSSYDTLVNNLAARGVQTYMLVGSQAVGDPGELLRAYPGPNWTAADAWVQSYAERFVEVVDHFKDRVRVYETFNEPNDWAGGTTHKVHPRWMARILETLYLNTKHFNGHAGVAAWQVTIVSGPLFSFDLTNASDYLDDVYWYGRNAEAWDWTHEQTGSFPLDGIGYHLYVAQSASQLGEVGSRFTSHLDAVWSVVTSNEGASTSKRIWVSEFGWPSASGESFQGSALTAGFATLKADWRVALACFFCQIDFSAEGWGIFRSDWSMKPSWSAFKAQTP
jgi:hypothetical protein